MLKIKNAIILAAGRGSRMESLCDSTPKPLLKINGKPIIENIIETLNRSGINDITIVSGYLHDQLTYLKDKYQLQIIVNTNWENTNNTTSLISCIDKLSDTLIINGDVIITDEKIPTEYSSSCTFAELNSNIDEWAIELDNNENVISFNQQPTNYDGYYQREITILNNDMSNKIRSEILNFDKNEYYEFLVLLCSKKYNIPFGIHKIKRGSFFDIDKKDDFIKYCSLFEK
ncbi:MAG: NTP transferase domain-containing protein [Mycoplasma sp.]